MQKQYLKIIKINKMENFFQEGYKIPQTSNYLKLTEGDHTFRIMASPVLGYVYFTKDNKPVRSREAFDETPDIKKDGRVNHFWAMPIYNYDAKRIQILEISQKSIMTQIKAYIDNVKWGNPRTYDLTINRKGAGQFDTEYTVMPNPHTEVPEEAKQAFEKTYLDLEKLFTGEDPFAKSK